MDPVLFKYILLSIIGLIYNGCLIGAVFYSIEYQIDINWCSGKDLFDQSHNPSHSTLYPDVLKIKTIIVEKQNFTKMLFVYFLQVYKSISDNSAAWTSWDYGFVNNM